MVAKVAKFAKDFFDDTQGGAFIIAGVAMPVLLGFAGLALEYGSSLITRAENQRTSDAAAYGAAVEYKKNSSETSDNKVKVATSVAKSVAALNGVTSGVTVSFDNPGNAEYVEVSISEDKTLILPRLIDARTSVTINTNSKVFLGTKITPCILALGSGEKDGFTANGGGTYNLKGCGVGSNGSIAANGQTLGTKCAAVSFKNQAACKDEIKVNPKIPLEDPFKDYFNSNMCDYTGSLPEDLATELPPEKGEKGGEKGEKGSGVFKLYPGVLCVDGFSSKFESISSDWTGNGNTLVFTEGVDLDMRGGEKVLSVMPQEMGGFAGVGLYAPKSDITVNGNAVLTIDGLGCTGIIANSITFGGNVTLNVECDNEEHAVSVGPPYLVE
ncbi:TadE/TadG family type IV pilus assembly protein [Roseovarius sp. D0-M9]|uniref:TadE/TadG family type IV pilus assembly protein n=1 Tax=Roseovarius sp. D0-M9 TaxID=3127117 RepID=UPI00300FD6BA